MGVECREREKRREMATLGGARACGGAAVRARSAGFGQASTRRAGVVPVLPSRSRPATTTRAAAWREAWSRLVEDERLPGPEVRAEDLPKLGSQAGWRASAKTAAAPVAFALQATLFGTVLDVSPVPPRPLPRTLAQSEKSRPDRRSLSLSVLPSLLQVFYVAVLVRILTSWFPNLPPLLDPVVGLARSITEPVFQPFRQLIPPLRLGNSLVDISGIIVIFLINFLRRYA